MEARIGKLLCGAQLLCHGPCNQHLHQFSNSARLSQAQSFCFYSANSPHMRQKELASHSKSKIEFAGSPREADDPIPRQSSQTRVHRLPMLVCGGQLILTILFFISVNPQKLAATLCLRAYRGIGTTRSSASPGLY